MIWSIDCLKMKVDVLVVGVLMRYRRVTSKLEREEQSTNDMVELFLSRKR